MHVFPFFVDPVSKPEKMSSCLRIVAVCHCDLQRDFVLTAGVTHLESLCGKPSGEKACGGLETHNLLDDGHVQGEYAVCLSWKSCVS